MKTALGSALLFFTSLLSTASLAQEKAIAPAAAPATVAKPAPAPYQLPLQLRGVGAATGVRIDNTFATQMSGSENITFVLGSYAFLNKRAVVALRAGYVGFWPKTGTSQGTTTNGLALGGYTWKFDDLRLAAYLGVTLPFGWGGGNTPNTAAAAANRSGVLARSAMDNAMFSVNDLTLIPGIDVAWVAKDFTIQLEATVLQLMRVRGELVQKDEQKTNFTSGLSIGYFIQKDFSVVWETRYQRWLSTPVAVAADEGLRHNLSMALGARAHFKLSDTTWFRPGVSVSRGLLGAMSRQDVTAVQLDLPFTF